MSFFARVRVRAIIALGPLLYRRDVTRSDLVRLGSDYGGWWVPADLIGPESICYLGGVGTDVTFDVALIDTFGCEVWAFDPTPASITWVESQDLDPRFHFVPLGLSGERGDLKFYAPAVAGHVSHSVKNLRNTTDYFVATVVPVSEAMADLGHDRVDLLKLDIEGAEHDTVARLLQDGIRPDVICVEYDQPEPLRWARTTTRRLREAGYGVCKVDGLNVTFVRRDRAAKVTKPSPPD